MDSHEHTDMRTNTQTEQKARVVTGAHERTRTHRHAGRHANETKGAGAHGCMCPCKTEQNKAGGTGSKPRTCRRFRRHVAAMLIAVNSTWTSTQESPSGCHGHNQNTPTQGKQIDTEDLHANKAAQSAGCTGAMKNTET